MTRITNERAEEIGRRLKRAPPYSAANIMAELADFKIFAQDFLVDRADDKAEIERLKQQIECARDEGANFVIEQLSDVLKAEGWSPCDGTETWDGDVSGTVYAVLRAARILDPETDELVTVRIASLEAERDELRKKAEAQFVAGMRRAAEIVRDNCETYSTIEGDERKALAPRRSGDLAGLSYAVAILAEAALKGEGK